MTNHFLESEELLSLLSQVDLDDAQLPTADAPVDLGAEGAADDLVAEADADDADAAALEEELDVLHEADDPVDVLKRGGLRSGDEDGVDALGVRVRGRVVDDVVEGELELRREGLRRVEGAARPLE